MMVTSSLECYPREFNEGFILALRCDRMWSSVWHSLKHLECPTPTTVPMVCMCQDQVKQKQTVTQVLTFAGSQLHLSIAMDCALFIGATQWLLL